MPDYDFSALGAQYNNEYLNTIYRGLLERGYGQRQAAAMLSKIVQDTGGDPYYSSGDGKRSGIMGWDSNGYRINPFMETNPKRELNRQLDYIVRNVAASDGEDELDEYGTKVYDIVSAPMANTYEGGGEVVERRRSGDADVSLEGYKQAKRDSIINAAVNKAIARTHGVTPMINGEPGESCLYTATDNYGRQYRVAGNQTFLANPQNYGFEVNGPVENTRVGDLYQMFDYTKNGLVPTHMTLITGYGNNGEPLVTYSRGDAYEDIYGDDYVKNRNLWQMPAYETYRFIGTPSDNARWENEFRALPLVEPIPKLRHPETQGNVYRPGGKLKSVAKKVADKISQATLRAAMADNPAVMQASGWDWDKDGNVVQGDPSAEGPTQLRNALRDVALMAIAEPVEGVIGGAITDAKLYKAAKLAREMNKGLKVVPEEVVTDVASGSVAATEAAQDALKSHIRVRVGDVEVNDPNVLYHVDYGDNAGAFNGGAYIKDGLLYPGESPSAEQAAYTWWNLGKPYADKIDGKKFTRLITIPKETEGVVHVRSQSNKIGQWNGRNGFVTNSEYVTPGPVDVNGGVYEYVDGYGWMKAMARGGKLK